MSFNSNTLKIFIFIRNAPESSGEVESRSKHTVSNEGKWIGKRYSGMYIRTHCDSVRNTGSACVNFWSRNPYFKRIEMPRSTTLHSVARALRNTGTHKAVVFRMGSILQKVSPGFDVCLRRNTPSSPSLYVLGRIKSDVSVIV